MIEKIIVLLLFVAVIAGCAAPTYEDGSSREYSDMPWNTPATWEGTPGVPGMNGYE